MVVVPLCRNALGGISIRGTPFALITVGIKEAEHNLENMSVVMPIDGEVMCRWVGQKFLRSKYRGSEI